MNVRPRDDDVRDATTVMLATASRERRTAEQRLMLALLCDAVYRYQAVRAAATPGRLRELHELSEWFASTDRSYVFAFETVCDVLGLDAGHIRLRLACSPANGRRHRCLGYS